MMFGMQSAPFTMTWPKLGEENPGVMESLKAYSAAKYGRTRTEVEREINERLGAKPARPQEMPGGSGSFVEEWKQRQAQVDEGALKKAAEAIERLEKADESAETVDSADSGEMAEDEVVKLR